MAGALGAACTLSVLTLAGPAPAALAAGDDYPYAWQGQCPIVPQEPIEEPTPSPAPSPSASPGPKPSATPTPEPTPPPPPPVLDPVSGHMYDPRGPKPECARRVWAINGSIGDPWSFVLRNCTSFVAWRLNETNGLDFTNDAVTADGEAVRWSDAKNWDDTARALGYRVDDVPAIGAVAQSDSGRVGHVAYVSGIGPGTVTIEEYNHATPGGYGTRTVPVETFRYLHLKDLAPSPLIGSDRPLVSAPDVDGEVWSASVNDAGTLNLSAPGRPTRRLGTKGAFSTLAAPSLVHDETGRTWVAATTREGKVLVGTKRKKGWALHPVAMAAPTSSPALATSTRGRLNVFTIDAAGTLTSRELKPNRRWTKPRRIGTARSWATHTAPVTARDGEGRAWVVAVARDGIARAQRATRGGWSRMMPLKGLRSALTATPSLTLAEDGRLHLHQVSRDGQLAVRTLDGNTWSRPQALDGTWSPYSSPAVSQIAGELQLAAVRDNGSVWVIPALPGEADQKPSLRAHEAFSAGDSTQSPALVKRANSGVYLLTGDGRRQRATLLMRPATAVASPASGTRAGFMP